MHILICDDDAAFGARMAEYVTVYFTARSVQVNTAVCTSAAEVLATPGLELYQLAFLDVDMPGANGMVLGRQLKQKCPGLILLPRTTASTPNTQKKSMPSTASTLT